MPRRQPAVFLPSINEDSEKTDERIQDIKKALKIEKIDGDKNGKPLRVRSAQNPDATIHDATDKDPPAPTKRGAGKGQPYLRSSSDKNLDAWNRKRLQGSSLLNGKPQRARTGSLDGSRQKLFGFGRRKITSPRIDNDRQKISLNDVQPDTIDLTKYEDVQAILQRFYVDDLKMDSSDPRLPSGSEDFINSLRAKAQRRFSVGELWRSNGRQALLHGRKSKTVLTDQLSAASVDGAERAIAHLRKHQAQDSPSKILSHKLESFKRKPTFEVTYARPMTLKSLQTTVAGTRNVPTSSAIQEQPANDCKKYCGEAKPMPKRRRATFLRPIKQKRKPHDGIGLLNNGSAEI